MNILVTGACGQLGSEIRIACLNSGDRYFFSDVNGLAEEQKSLLQSLGGDKVDLSTSRLDITDIEEVRRFVAENDIECIVNCAAFTNVDAAESNYELAEKLNAEAPENLATAVREVGGLLVHISTDYIFGREVYDTPCLETFSGAPTGVYGLTKLHGEQRILSSGCRYIIFRTSWLYSEFGKNFCKTMISLTSSKPSVKVVSDQKGTPTYALDLAETIVRVLSKRLFEANTGIFNYSNEGECTWFDFAKKIAEYAGNTACEITPCSSEEYPSPVVRPAYSVLDKTKVKETFSISIPLWTDSLKKCISRLG